MARNEFLEELLSVDPRDGASDHFFHSSWIFNYLDDTPFLPPPRDLPLPESLSETSFEYCPFTHQEPSLNQGITAQETQHHPAALEDAQSPCLMNTDRYKNRGFAGFCKTEMEQSSDSMDHVFDVGFHDSDRKMSKRRKLSGQPSKNLMAERRRRKRLNDRLSMLRSIVPKISKMDRTSILGDAIEYMKELSEKINKLQDEEDDVENVGFQRVKLIRDPKGTDEAFVRNSPKFDVEKRETDTRVEVRCAPRTGLLLSTVATLEDQGLEIQQCVISSFNDFSLQASCSEDAEKRGRISHENIKQALFWNAGYGGRCL